MPLNDELKKMLDAPIYLAPNTYLHFYNGGKLRAEFMGEPDPKDDYRSEEWIFSTNRAVTPGRDNPPEKGLSKIQLPNGDVVLLKTLLEAFPKETLGEKHFEKFGPNLGILVKIFDVGEGSHIPIHWHPSPEFASKYLNSPNGKNEAWVVVATRPGAKAWIGWKEDISKEEFSKWADAQDIQTIREHMHMIEPRIGDVIFLRDSFVHSLGTGLCILEPQEPTDWNILAEWAEYPFEKEDGLLGLDWDTALEAADFSKMSLDYLNSYVLRTPDIARKEDGNVEEQLVPDEAKQFFNVERLKISSKLDIADYDGFYCVVTTRGSGVLHGDFGDVPIERGKSVFIPACLSGYEVINNAAGPLELVFCYPPKL